MSTLFARTIVIILFGFLGAIASIALATIFSLIHKIVVKTLGLDKKEKL